MRRINDVFARHQWLQIVCSWALATVMVLLVFPGRSPLSSLIRVMLCSTAAVWIAVRRRRREKAVAGGSAHDLVTLDHMLRRGTVPTEPAQREAMRTLVDRRLHRTRHRKAALVFMGVLLSCVATATFFTTSLPRAAAYGVFCVAFFAYLVVAGGMALHRLDFMRASLESTDDGPDQTGPTRHAA